MSGNFIKRKTSKLKDQLENNLLQFKQIPAFTDNYLWVIIQNHQAWVVDPGDAEPIIALLEREKLTLKGILITHHHQDHIGGVEQLMAWSKDHGQGPINTIGPLHPKITPLDRVITDQDEIELFPGVIAKAISVPGHTLSHVAYFLPQSKDVLTPRLYCGDTLFATGCGRLFEGTAEQMYQSLQKFAQLPDETLVCCAHEYTLSNIKFAQHIEPKNHDLSVWAQVAKQMRSESTPTVPTTIGFEKKVNPFMRCNEPSMIKNIQQLTETSLQTSSDVLAVIRKMKDSF
jgi:hydroxyacylglutathione hydrolase